MPRRPDPTPPPTLGTSASLTSVVRIGDGSYSPGDAYVESLLPRVRRLDDTSSSSSAPSSMVNKVTDIKGSSLNLPGLFEDEQEADGQQRGPPVTVLPLAENPSIRRAQQECMSLQNGNAVTILEDEDVQEEVVQVVGQEAELVFRCRNIFRFLVLFVKNLEHFFELTVEILDNQQQYRQLHTTNARSLAKVEPTLCQLPLRFGHSPGWRYLCLDLQDLTQRAFGTKHVTTTLVRVRGHCRLLRIFFQDEQYADTELPPYLTFLG